MQGLPQWAHHYADDALTAAVHASAAACPEKPGHSAGGSNLIR